MSHRSFFGFAFALALMLAGVCVAPTSASGGGFDGIYVNSDGGNVAYFELVQNSEKINGSYTVVVRNTNSSEGLQQSRFTVSGSGNPRAAILGVAYDTPDFQAPLSYHWIARWNGTGFVLELPLGSGQIASVNFHRSTIREVNGLVGTMNALAERDKQTREQNIELASARRELHRNVLLRLGDLHAIAQAQVAFNAAQDRKRSAEEAVADLLAESHTKLSAALSPAPTSLVEARRRETRDLQDQANYAAYAAQSARDDVRTADDQLALVGHALDSMKQILADHDTAIARLRSVVARDAGDLAIR